MIISSSTTVDDGDESDENESEDAPTGPVESSIGAAGVVVGVVAESPISEADAVAVNIPFDLIMPGMNASAGLRVNNTHHAAATK
jgi:hypothetical protein